MEKIEKENSVAILQKQPDLPATIQPEKCQEINVNYEQKNMNTIHQHPAPNFIFPHSSVTINYINKWTQKCQAKL